MEEKDMLKVQAADSRSRAVFGSQVKQAKERQQLNPLDTGRVPALTQEVR